MVLQARIVFTHFCLIVRERRTGIFDHATESALLPNWRQVPDRIPNAIVSRALSIEHRPKSLISSLLAYVYISDRAAFERLLARRI